MLKIFQNSISVLILAILFSISAHSQMYNSDVEAKINIEENGSMVAITGFAINKTDSNRSLRYVLSVIKSDTLSSNSSNNSQSGRFVMEVGEKKNLSSTTINTNEKDRVIVLLLIYDEDDKPLGMDRLVINGTEEDIELKRLEEKERKEAINISPDAQEKAVDGFVLRGIVTEDTKTKPGADFYKMFYSLYNEKKINGEEIVNIKEVLSLNNNTKIEIYVANEKMLEFFVRPQNEYLKAVADVAVKRVYLYLKQYKANKNIRKYY